MWTPRTMASGMMDSLGPGCGASQSPTISCRGGLGYSRPASDTRRPSAAWAKSLRFRRHGLRRPIMSLYGLQKLIRDVNRKPDRRAAYMAAPGTFADSYDLTADERDALLRL